MAYHEDFGSSLYNFFSDMATCLFTMFCCPCQVAFNKAALDGRHCTIYDLICSCGCQEYFNRQQLRAKYGFEQSACSDCLAMVLCPCCTVCQDAREIAARESTTRPIVVRGAHPGTGSNKYTPQ